MRQFLWVRACCYPGQLTGYVGLSAQWPHCTLTPPTSADPLWFTVHRQVRTDPRTHPQRCSASPRVCVHIGFLLTLQHMLLIHCVNFHWTLLPGCHRCDFKDYWKRVCTELSFFMRCNAKNPHLFHLAVETSRTSVLTDPSKPSDFWQSQKYVCVGPR